MSAIAAACSDESGPASEATSAGTHGATSTTEPVLFQRSTDAPSDEAGGSAITEDSESDGGTSSSVSTVDRVPNTGTPGTDAETSDTETVTTVGEIPTALAAATLSTDEVGVPDTWAIRDAHTEAQLDGDDRAIAFGVLPCALGPPLARTDDLWLRRRYLAPTEPLDDGLVAVEIVAELQDDADLDTRLDELDGCAPGDVASIERIRRETSSTGSPVTRAAYSIYASPSATAAFPSHHSVAIAHSNGLTVTVVHSGVDTGQSWETEANELASTVLERIT